MVGLPYFDDAVPQPARQTRLSIQIGGAAGDDSGFGGLADAAASLLGGPQTGSWAEHLVSLSLWRGMAAEVDVAELVIADIPDAPQAALGDSGSVGATGDASGTLFNGVVIGIEQRADGLKSYRLGNGSHSLAQTRVNQSLSAMSVADLVQYAAAELGLQVEVDVSGSDSVIAQTVLSDAASLWDHLAQLAALRGCNVWFDADGVLHLADQLEQGDSVATLTWGQDLLEARLGQRSPHTGAVTVFGGGRSSDGFTLRKQAAPNRAEQGDGAPQRFNRSGLLNSPEELAGSAAATALAGLRRTGAGELLVPGSALLEPGSVVELVSMPGSGSGLYLIHSVRHSFDSAHGWLCRLRVSEAGDAAASSGLLGAVGGLL